VEHLIARHPDPALWRLISLRPHFLNISRSAQQLLAHWPEFEDWPALPAIAKDGASTLSQALQISESLSSLTAADEIFSTISEIETDIFGTYFAGLRIEIYWMGIALFAGAFGLRVQDLAAVTLIHELAHAYTHLGLDISGESWKADGFERS